MLTTVLIWTISQTIQLLYFIITIHVPGALTSNTKTPSTCRVKQRWHKMFKHFCNKSHQLTFESLIGLIHQHLISLHFKFAQNISSVVNISHVCKHFPVLSIFIIYDRVWNYNITTGATNGAGTAHPSGTHEFTPGI